MLAQEGPSPNAAATKAADLDKAAPVSKAKTAGAVKPEPLSDEESAKLAARDQEPGPEISGGALSNLHLTYIVIALAAAVIVLILK